MLTGTLTTIGIVAWLWIHAGKSSASLFSKNPELWNYLVPVLIAVAVFVLVQVAHFGWNLTQGRAGVLEELLKDEMSANVTLASMVEGFTHKQQETHDLLVRFAERARELRDRHLGSAGDLQALQTDYTVWDRDLDALLGGRCSVTRSFSDCASRW